MCGRHWGKLQELLCGNLVLETHVVVAGLLRTWFGALAAYHLVVSVQ